MRKTSRNSSWRASSTVVALIILLAGIYIIVSLLHKNVVRLRRDVSRMRVGHSRLREDIKHLRQDLLGGGKLDSDCGLDYYAQGGIVVDGTAYFTADRHKGDIFTKSIYFPFVVAFDADSFKKIRTYSFRDTYDSAPLLLPKKDGTWLIIAHEYIRERTVALNRDTGDFVWLSQPNQPGSYFFGYSYYVRNDGSYLILVSCENGLHAISGEDGKEVWVIEREVRGGVTPCVDQDGGWIYYQCDGEIMKLQAADGSIVKSAKVDSPNKCASWNTVLIDDSHGHYIATYWYGKPEWDSAIRVYDNELNQVWEKKSLPVGKKATLTYVDGKLVTGSGNSWNARYSGDKWRYIAAYSIKTGDTVWKCDLASHSYSCILNVPYFNGYLYAETQDKPGSTSKLFRINASTGKLEETLDYKRPIASCAPCVIAHGKLLSGDQWTDSIMATVIATNSNADWPGPFCDPQTNQYALPYEEGAENVPMKETHCNIPLE